MHRSRIGVCVGVLLALAACTPIDPSKVADEKRYRTGSNIAQRDHGMRDSVQTKTIDTADPSLGMPPSVHLPPGSVVGH